jgi:TniQ
VLPSSLDPLPGESLVGFLLRLAHRLECSPARILELADFAGSQGWQHVSVIPHHAMLQLTSRERDGLARAARLTPQEAEALCFGQLRDRFPLPPPAAREQAPAKRFDWWLHTTFSRYCPQCLAGDGTAIQNDHGGAWKRAWRLPVVFACETHSRLLDHRCPACGHPALGIHGNSGGTLVPGMMHRGLHPAQCRADSRTARCGQRLDSTDGSDVPAAEVLELQQRLTALLRPDGPAQVMSAGEPCSPQQYFTDLRLVSYLAVTTWPGMRHLAPASQLARAVDMLAAHQAPDGGKLPQSPATLARPADASAAACLLLIADQLLKGDTAAVREAVRAQLPETIDRASRTGWRLTFLKTDEAAYSPGLSAAVRPVLSRDRWNPGQGRRRQPELRTRLGAQHVPQHLPEKWLRWHFGASAAAVPMTALQRATTTRLVQMLAGGSKEEAARYLGFPKPARHRQILAELPATAGLAPARQADNRFDELVRAIAAELRGGELINYQARRTALSTWELDEETWQHLASEARARTYSRYLARGPHDRVDRLAASVAVWQRATHGHYRYAPLLKTAPGDWFRRSDRVTWKIMLGRGSSSVGIELHRLLSDYADQLGTRIDAS